MKKRKKIITVAIDSPAAAGAGLGARGAGAGAGPARAGQPIDDAVAVVVDVVTGLGRRRDPGAGPEGTRRAGLGARGAGAHVRAAGARDRLVDAPVAVVVEVVADLAAGDAAAAHALVDRPVAVVVDAVAGLAGRSAAGPAGVGHALVGGAVTVVVGAVAALGRRQPTGPTGVGDALVDQGIAVVVGAVARLDQERVLDDLTEGRAQGLPVAGEVRGAGATARGDRVEPRRGGRETDDVHVDARRAEVGGCGAGVSAAGLIAIGEEDDRVGPAGAAAVSGDGGAGEAGADRVQQSGQGGRADGAELAVAAAEVVAEVTGGGGGAEPGLLVVHPAKERVDVLLPGEGAGVGEVIAVEAVFLLPVDGVEVEIAVVVVIGPHDVIGVAPVAYSEIGDLEEGAVAAVLVEAVVVVILAEVDVEVPVAVVVAPGHGNDPTWFDQVNKILGRPDLGEGTVTLVLVEVVLFIEVGEVEVEVTVVVVVGKGGVGAVKGAVDPGGGGAVGEGAVALVVVERVDVITPVGDVEVETAVAVVVAPGQIGAVQADIAGTGDVGNVFEGLGRGRAGKQRYCQQRAYHWTTATIFSLRSPPASTATI